MPTNIVIMVLGIIAITTFGRIYMAKHGLLPIHGGRRHHRHALASHRPDRDADGMREEIVALKERIAVLERVITDTNSTAALEREIEKLR